jgi:hypothetical protein
MADKKKHAGGRPKLFKSAEEMQKKIDAYFESCKGEVLKDKEDNVIYNKWGIPVIINDKPPTVTGLALALGFNSRTSLLNYEAEKEFMNTITCAKARVEEYAESRLFDKDGANGAKFSLANNFKEWRERSEVESVNHNINEDLDKLPEDERHNRIRESMGKLSPEQRKKIFGDE